MLLVVTLVMCACGPKTPESNRPSGSTSGPPGHGMEAPPHEVLVICKSRDLSTIDYLGKRISTGCNGASAIPLVSALYEAGVASGIAEYALIHADMTTLCLCKRAGCQDDFYQRTFYRMKDRFESLRSGESEGRAVMDTTPRQDSCVNPASAADAVKAGFKCAVSASTTSRTFHDARIEGIMKTEHVDRAAAESIAESCTTSR